MNTIPVDFFDRDDVVSIAKELIGKILLTNFDNVITSGRIVETEAYLAFSDKASHSYNGRRTAKNEHMYSAPGTVYVYICYGMHQMMNIVTNKKDIPDAVLIRALEPLEGIETMLERSGKIKVDHTLTKGPGNVGRSLGIHKKHSGELIHSGHIFLLEDGNTFTEDNIVCSKRIGVESAGAHRLLPYRFYVKGNKNVSGRPFN